MSEEFDEQKNESWSKAETQFDPIDRQLLQKLVEQNKTILERHELHEGNRQYFNRNISKSITIPFAVIGALFGGLISYLVLHQPNWPTAARKIFSSDFYPGGYGGGIVTISLLGAATFGFFGYSIAWRNLTNGKQVSRHKTPIYVVFVSAIVGALVGVFVGLPSFTTDGNGSKPFAFDIYCSDSSYERGECVPSTGGIVAMSLLGAVIFAVFIIPIASYALNTLKRVKAFKRGQELRIQRETRQSPAISDDGQPLKKKNNDF